MTLFSFQTKDMQIEFESKQNADPALKSISSIRHRAIDSHHNIATKNQIVKDSVNNSIRLFVEWPRVRGQNV